MVKQQKPARYQRAKVPDAAPEALSSPCLKAGASRACSVMKAIF